MDKERMPGSATVWKDESIRKQEPRLKADQAGDEPSEEGEEKA